MGNDLIFPTTKGILRKLGGDVIQKRITLGERETIESPFSKLVGLKVVDYVPGRMFLSVPSTPPSTEGWLLSAGSFDISYGTYNQMLSKPCLLISDYASLSVRCPSFFYDQNKYQALLYAFEEVTDTMGLGLTFAKGWHAVNTSTFANEPFDPKAYPLVSTSVEIEKGDEYVKEMFSLRERISFTVKSENIVSDDGDSGAVVIAATPLNDNAIVYVSFILAAGKLYRSNNGTATITYTETIVPIDPKYLPGVCLPVVEIANPEEITKAEGAKLTACIGMPIIVKTVTVAGPVSVVASYSCAMNIHAYSAVVLGETVTLSYSESVDVWQMGGNL